MTVSLSALIRLGFKETCASPGATHLFREAQRREPGLRDVCLVEAPRLMQRLEVPACRQDEVLAATIRAYRSGPPSFWAPILLSMLGPALVRMARRLRVQPPAVDEEDVDQQVILEALRAAALMPLPEGCRFVQRRLIAFSTKRLTRWLERERRRQASQASFEIATERMR